MSQLTIDWSNRWLGGFCALGAVGGLPVRGPDYAAHPALPDRLILPPSIPGADRSPSIAEVTAAWSTALGEVPVVLVRSVAQARVLLLQALEVRAGEPVALPANATRPLVETVKCHGARPCLVDLDAWLALQPDPAQTDAVRVVWSQPVGGLPVASTFPAPYHLIDHTDTLPLPDAGSTALAAQTSHATAILWGLYLSDDETQAGAVVAFVGEHPAARMDLHAAVQSRIGPADRPDPARALAQCQRLTGSAGLAARQVTALARVWEGLQAAAGLPLLPLADMLALPHAVAVQVPAVCDAATFYAYVRGENTPVRWLPELRPLHYAALRAGGAPAHAATAAHLTRWLLAPVGPEYTAEEISHTILGIVKASDYLGLRWYTDLARAAEYAALMHTWYGPDHDAYRPLFALE